MVRLERKYIVILEISGKLVMDKLNSEMGNNDEENGCADSKVLL